MKAEKDLILNVLAVFLLCITPVLCLYNSHAYPLMSEAFSFFILSSLIGTLAAAYFIRFRVFRYVAFVLGISVLVVFLTGSRAVYGIAAAALIVLILRDRVAIVVLASTLVIAGSSFFSIERNYPTNLIDRIDEKLAGHYEDLKPVFHLVFDEAAGLRTLKEAGKSGEARLDKMVGVLTEHGFSIIRDAHSSSMWTHLSLGHVVKFEEAVNSRKENDSYFINESALFDLLNKDGYEINIVQSSHVDFCTSAESYARSCYEYPINSLSYLKDNDLNELSFWLPATLWKLRLLSKLNRYLPDYAWSRRIGLHQRLPSHFGSLSQRAVQDEFLGRLDNDAGRSGQFYWVHFMYPHSSYYQSPNCEVKRSFEQWGDNGQFKFSSSQFPGPNIDQDQRRLMYDDYLEQFECFTSVLDSILDAVLERFPNAIVIVHGDHSSRISTRHIHDTNLSEFQFLDDQNFSDLFPTLLALRYPGSEPKILNCRMSLLEFAQHFYLGRVSTLGKATAFISERLFADSQDCVASLPTLKSLR